MLKHTSVQLMVAFATTVDAVRVGGDLSRRTEREHMIIAGLKKAYDNFQKSLKSILNPEPTRDSLAEAQTALDKFRDLPHRKVDPVILDNGLLDQHQAQTIFNLAMQNGQYDIAEVVLSAISQTPDLPDKFKQNSKLSLDRMKVIFNDVMESHLYRVADYLLPRVLLPMRAGWWETAEARRYEYLQEVVEDTILNQAHSSKHKLECLNFAIETVKKLKIPKRQHPVLSQRDFPSGESDIQTALGIVKAKQFGSVWTKMSMF